MPRSSTSIQSEITVLEALILTLPAIASVSADGTTVSNQRYLDVASRLDLLYARLDRISGASPMFARGRLTGLGRG